MWVAMARQYLAQNRPRICRTGCVFWIVLGFNVGQFTHILQACHTRLNLQSDVSSQYRSGVWFTEHSTTANLTLQRNIAIVQYCVMIRFTVTVFHSVESPSMVDPQWNIWYWGSKWNLHTVCWGSVGCAWGMTSVYFGITSVCFIPSGLPVVAVEPEYRHQDFFIFVKSIIWRTSTKS